MSLHPRLGWAALAAVMMLPVLAAQAPDAWARYFPSRSTEPTDDAGWTELAREFPNRIKRAQSPSAPAAAPAATEVEIRAGITYVRVRNLANDLDAVGAALAHPRLIIDLRYIHSEVAESLQFGRLLARHPFNITPAASNAAPPEPPAAAGRAKDQITLCLVNRATSGPLEAVLDALQNHGDVLLVGTQSAGDTGCFRPVEHAPTWRVIADDYRRENGPSLLDVGVTPSLFVETTPDAEDAAYLAFDGGAPVGDLLDPPVRKSRFDEAKLQQQFSEIHPNSGRIAVPGSASPPPSDKPASENQTPPPASTSADTPPHAVAESADAKSTEPAPFDRSLQRAVSTLVAFDIFHTAPAAPVTP